MAYDDNQNESPLPVEGKKKNFKSNQLLPKYFRSSKNNKFLITTIYMITVLRIQNEDRMYPMFE